MEYVDILKEKKNELIEELNFIRTQCRHNNFDVIESIQSDILELDRLIHQLTNRQNWFIRLESKLDNI